MQSNTMNKQTIRGAMLKRRSELTPEQKRTASDAILPRVMEFIRSRKDALLHRTIMSYSSFRGEVSTAQLNRAIREAGYTLVLPYTDENFRIRPFIIDDRSCFRASPLGISEPDAESCREADPGDIDLILMPGIAFDEQGYRIGFGKGCYDIFLPSVSAGTPVVGIAYDFQVISRIPREEHDRAADILITESRTLFCRRPEDAAGSSVL